MIAISLYDAETGIFTGNHLVLSDEAMIAANTPPGHAHIEGHHDHLTKRVNIETGEIVDYTPPAPSANQIAASERLSRHKSALVRIIQLDNQSVRALREQALGIPGALDRLQGYQSEIESLRKDIIKEPI